MLTLIYVSIGNSTINHAINSNRVANYAIGILIINFLQSAFYSITMDECDLISALLYFHMETH